MRVKRLQRSIGMRFEFCEAGLSACRRLSRRRADLLANDFAARRAEARRQPRQAAPRYFGDMDSVLSAFTFEYCIGKLRPV